MRSATGVNLCAAKRVRVQSRPLLASQGGAAVWGIEVHAMVVERFASADPRARIAAAVLRLLFADAYARNFAIRLWDGSAIPASERARFTLRVNSPGALRTAFRPPVDLNAGRAFAAGAIDCDGEVEYAVDELYGAMHRMSRSALPRMLTLLLRLPKETLPDLREASLHGKMHSVERDRAAIGFHYDQPVPFYASFLDRELIYSCAYFDDGVQTLDDAQIAKLDYTLRKLRVRPGERVLDIGCGWGALVIHAAQRFGARALGVTLSPRQCEEANRRIAAAELGDRERRHVRARRALEAAGVFSRCLLAATAGRPFSQSRNRESRPHARRRQGERLHESLHFPRR